MLNNVDKHGNVKSLSQGTPDRYLGIFKAVLSCLTLISFLALPGLLVAQGQDQEIYIDPAGIMRWKSDNTELTGFGVNYTVPFAHAYRAGKKLGIDHRAAIDQDIYHFKRLGFDLYRVHVWDCEISDTVGNLLDNIHLELFDYLLFKLKENNIRSIITPIAYWGNGWPDPDEPTPGFSTKYGKAGCLVEPAAHDAQARYLSQFVKHVNRYTGIAYKDDSDILAFEISNEPHHQGTHDEVVAFVSRMKHAIQLTGCTKPVFYNVSHSIHLAEAYGESGVDGGTFQWYPTGLVYQRELKGNMLPMVDSYPIPFDSVLEKNGMARIVYEFDAADMLSSYMYPAMGRSFRTAGMQLATHFSYDPTFLAPYNTEYNTHFMNLVYTPRKALGLMICAEVFRQIPLYTDYGCYPHNTQFGNFRVDPFQDLAEMVTSNRFYYTNHTTTEVPFPDSLEHIAGWGNSPLVEYDGTGAYFLDRIGPGLWNLEVFTDVSIVDNPLGQNDLDTRRAHTVWQQRNMTLKLPDMDKGFIVMNVINEKFSEVNGGQFVVTPGKYIVLAVDWADRELANYAFPDNETLREYFDHQVQPTLMDRYMIHEPAHEISYGSDVEIVARMVSPVRPDSMVLEVRYENTTAMLPMEFRHGFTYKSRIPAAYTKNHTLDYHITAYFGDEVISYPEVNSSDQVQDWLRADHFYKIPIVQSRTPLFLFEPERDQWLLNRQWVSSSKLVDGDQRNPKWLFLDARDILADSDEGGTGLRKDYSMRLYVGDLIRYRRSELSGKKTLVVEGTMISGKSFPVTFRLVDANGRAREMTVELKRGKSRYNLSLRKFTGATPVLLPRAYPTFTNYYACPVNANSFDIRKLEAIQISLGKDAIFRENENYQIGLGAIWLK